MVGIRGHTSSCRVVRHIHGSLSIHIPTIQILVPAGRLTLSGYCSGQHYGQGMLDTNDKPDLENHTTRRCEN